MSLTDWGLVIDRWRLSLSLLLVDVSLLLLLLLLVEVDADDVLLSLLSLLLLRCAFLLRLRASFFVAWVCRVGAQRR